VGRVGKGPGTGGPLPGVKGKLKGKPQGRGHRTKRKRIRGSWGESERRGGWSKKGTWGVRVHSLGNKKGRGEGG